MKLVPASLPIYVDELKPSRGNHGGWPQWCHFFTLPGCEADLHAAAEKLELKPAWYQTTGLMPHYDLSAVRRVFALDIGAMAVDREGLAEIVRLWRADRVSRKQRSLSAQLAENKTNPYFRKGDEYQDQNRLITAQEFTKTVKAFLSEQRKGVCHVN